MCKENGIEITGSIFVKSVKSLEENISYVKENFGEEYLTVGVLTKSNKNLRQTLPYLKKLGVLETVKTSPTILLLRLDEIQERIEFMKKIGEPIVKSDGKKFNSILLLPRRKYTKRLREYGRISGQDIGKATYMATGEKCDEARDVINEALARQANKEEYSRE